MRHARSHRRNSQTNRQTSEGNGSAAGWSPLNDPSGHQACVIQPSQAAESVPSVPGQEQMLLDPPLTPNQLPTDLTASLLDASAEDLPVQQSNQPMNDQGNVVMPQWSSTEMNDIITSETSPWDVPPDALGDLDWISLLTGSDFDLDALNKSLFETTENQATDTIQNPNEAQGLVQRRWHTFSESIVSSGQTTPNLRCSSGSDSGHGHIHMIADDSCRQKLDEGLQQRVQSGILPSTGFLVSVSYLRPQPGNSHLW